MSGAFASSLVVDLSLHWPRDACSGNYGLRNASILIVVAHNWRNCFCSNLFVWASDLRSLLMALSVTRTLRWTGVSPDNIPLSVITPIPRHTVEAQYVRGYNNFYKVNSLDPEAKFSHWPHGSGHGTIKNYQAALPSCIKSLNPFSRETRKTKTSKY